MIPQRFRDRVLRHALSVYKIPTYPLILAIQGTPGVGKTYQTYQSLSRAQFTIFRESASALQGKHEGDSVEAFGSLYEAARVCAQDAASPSPVILIEDFDLSGAVRIEKTEYTVNQQLLVSSLMNLCDGIDPGGGTATRIPIYFTGNNFASLHEPLRRHGRLDVFTWSPSHNELVEVVAGILQEAAAEPNAAAAQLVALFPAEPVATIRFLLDQIESLYIHSQVAHQDNLGLVVWTEAQLQGYVNIATERLVADVLRVHETLDRPDDFLTRSAVQQVNEV